AISINPSAVYTIRGVASGKCVEILAASTANSAKVQINSCAATSAAQTFRLQVASGTFYNVVNTNSGKCLDVSGKLTTDGAAVIQYQCNGGTNQQWTLTDTSGGAVRLTARHSNKVMEVNGGATANGTAIVQRTWSGATHQQFVVAQVPGGGSGGATGSGGAGGGASSSGGGPGSGGFPDAGSDAPLGSPDASIGGDALSGDGGAVSCAEQQPSADPYSISIAGQWDFTPQGGTAKKIQVPGGGWIKQGFSAPTGTYRTTITVPTNPTLGAAQTTLLELGAVNHEATLTVGTTMVGKTMTAFTPSVFDITHFVTPGQSYPISILVRGRDAFKNASGRRLVPAAADWSPNVPQGIYRSAMLRVYPDVYISDAFVRTSVSAKTLTYDVWVTNTGAAARQVTLSGKLGSWNCDAVTYPEVPASNVTVAPGATMKVTVGPLPWTAPPSSYWWPNVPFQQDYHARLHNLHITVADATHTIHSRVVRFGFRETEQRRADAQHVYYYLNGVRVSYRGDSLQGVDYDSINFAGGPGDAYDTFPGFLPPSAGNGGWPQAVRNVQQLNYNVVRIHQEPAPPYMIDVADELGLMIIDESAIRGTDGQDFVMGHDNMVNHVRQLVLRDRNHPSIIRWSMSNEENLSAADSAQFATDLYNAIVALDPTRPVSADVGGSFQQYNQITQPNFATFGHYLPDNLGKYTEEVGTRTDRPLGQGEYIWPKDVTRQGFMWFATSTMAMRVKDASDLRPYTLLSAWSSFVPGVKTTMMRLEPTYPEGAINPPLFGEDNLPDPWSNPIVMRIQRAFNPVLVADQAYWEANKMSNANGDWPISKPALAKNADAMRNLLIFNDTFAGTAITVTWELRAGSSTGAVASMGTFMADVPLGSRVTHPITIHTPATGTSCVLVLRAQKDGSVLFDDTAQIFMLN
ncbi:MAG: RICIN domain-containing protein, partial [Myxococcales bacterium]